MSGRETLARRAVADIDGRGARFEIGLEACPRVVWRIWGSGPPLVLLHGGAGSWTHWIRNVDALADGRQVLAVDMPGFGESADLAGADDADRIADCVEASLSRLPAAAGARVDVAAFSFGTVIAGRWALRHPGRIASLTLLGAVGLGVERREPVRYARIDPGLDEDSRFARHADNLSRMMLSERVAADDLAIHVHATNMRALRFRSRPISLQEISRDTLPELACPITFVWGARDAIYPPDREAREAFVRSLGPRARCAFVDGAGHWVQYEAAARVNALLGEGARLEGRALR